MQSRLSFFVLAIAVALLAVSGLGCPSSSSCNVDSPCEDEGQIRCADGTTVEACTRNANNCLGWVATPCATGMVCEEGAEETGCVVACDHECDPMAHPACGADGVSIETCELQNDGCFDLFVTDCEVDLVCDDSGEEVVCTCVDDCDPEMYPACSEDSSAVETCVEGLDGCFDMVATDCGADALCEDDGAEPACVVQCTDDCDPADYPACSATGFAIDDCVAQADGCTDIVPTDCPAGEACDDATITCQATGCSDDCVAADYPACGADGTSIDACERQADGCYDLTNTACGALEVCDASGGAPVCGCVNDCDPANYPACAASGLAVEACEMGADGCYDMVVTDCGAGEACNANTIVCEATGCSDDCAAGDYPACNGDNSAVETCEMQNDGCLDIVSTACGAQEVCDASGGAPVCTCVNDCDPGNYPACSGDTLSVETCEQQIDGCYDLVSTACQNGDICDPNSFTCVAPCQNDCDPANYPACSADTLAIETCEEQADTCYDIVTTACGGDLFCDDSSGQPECICTDDCDPADFPACSADTLAIETCVAQADSCYDVITTACGGDLTCDDSGGAPACVCTDECPTDGELACSLDLTAITLCEAQADGCNDLLIDTDCAGSAQECDPGVDPVVCVACTDECPAVDDTRCNADWIETCVVGPDTCLDWSQTTDCGGNGQYCDDSVDPLVCADFGLLVSGTDCNDANLVALNIPAELPAIAQNETTCGAVNDYEDTCMGGYDGGEDVVYLLEVTAATSFNVILDPKGTTWTGMGVGLGCPLDAADCLIGGGYSGGDAYMTGCLDAAPGSYTLMVDTYPAPDCIPDYDIWIQECVCVPGEAACLDATTLSTCNAMGQWDETVCDNGCQQIGGVDQCAVPLNSCEQATDLDVSGGSASLVIDNTTLTNQWTAYSCLFSDKNGADAWASFTLDEEAMVTIETSGPGVIDDTVMALFDACGGNELDCNDDIGGGVYYSQIQQTLPAGTYYVVTEPYSAGDVGDWTLTVTVVPRQASVLWDFEGEVTTPVVGNGTAALGATLAGESFPAGDGSTDSWSTNTWSTGALDVDKYYEFSTDLTGLSGAQLRFAERRSGTGPGEFVVNYSIDGGANFVEVPNSLVTLPDNTSWRSHSFDLPAAVDDQATVSVRIYGYSAEGTSGTWRIDDVGYFFWP